MYRYGLVKDNLINFVCTVVIGSMLYSGGEDKPVLNGSKQSCKAYMTLWCWDPV